MTYRPPQCSEIEPGGHEDCTWCTGVDLQNAAHGRQVVPVSRTEYEALRVAGGDGPAENPGDGSNFGQLVAGMRRRYGWSPMLRVGASFDVVWTLLPPGTAFGIQGSMGSLGTRWRRWDPGFTGPHAAYGQREDGGDRIWWMNPQAPSTFAGEWMTKDDLRRFYQGLPGAALVTTTIGSRAPQIPDTDVEEEMVEITIDPYPTPIPCTGTNVTLFLPDGTSQKVATLSSLAIGTAVIFQSTNRAPKGAGWTKLGKRPWAGWFVPTASIQLAFDPADPLQAARAAGRESYRREVDAFLESHP